MELTADVLDTVKARINDRWSREAGCSFTVIDGRGVNWDIMVHGYNKWDCLAIKHGTLGKTSKTICSFDARDEAEKHKRISAITLEREG